MGTLALPFLVTNLKDRLPTFAVSCDVSGYDTQGDGGGGPWKFDPASFAVHNGGTVIRPTLLTAQQPGRWLNVYSGPTSAAYFGAKIDGSASDAALSAALAVSDHVRIPGPMRLSADMAIPAGKTLHFDASGAALNIDAGKTLSGRIALAGPPPTQIFGGLGNLNFFIDCVGPISPLWFGMVVDDPTKAAINDVAIARAIASAGKHASGISGAIIEFPHGSIVWVSATIVFDGLDSICVQMASSAGYFDGFGETAAAIKWAGAPGGTVMHWHECNNALLENIQISGEGVAGTGLLIDATGGSGNPSKSGIWRNVYVYNCTAFGIDFGNTTNPDMTGHSFEHVRAFSCGVGMRQRGYQTTGNVFSDWIVVGYTTFGFYIDGGTCYSKNCNFGAYDNGATADVYVTNGADQCVFRENLHETFNTAYGFEPYVSGPGGTLNRANVTVIDACHMLVTGNKPGLKIVDFEQTGQLHIANNIFDGFAGYDCIVHVKGATGANPANIKLDTNRYRNGATLDYVPSIGGAIIELDDAGVDPSTWPKAADFAAPNSISYEVSTIRQFHNAVLAFSSTYSGAADSPFAKTWVRLLGQVLTITSKATLLSGLIAAIQNNGVNKFTVDYAGSVVASGDMTFGAGQVRYTSGAAAPTTGTWGLGSVCVNSAPQVGHPIQWVCTVAGTPGTWVAGPNL